MFGISLLYLVPTIICLSWRNEPFHKYVLGTQNVLRRRAGRSEKDTSHRERYLKALVKLVLDHSLAGSQDVFAELAHTHQPGALANFVTGASAPRKARERVFAPGAPPALQ